MKQEIRKAEHEALEALNGASDPTGVRALKARYVGRKGAVTKLLRKLSSLPAEERPETGRLLNEVKKRLEEVFEKALQAFEADHEETLADALDVTLPGRPVARGRIHPITQITRAICEIFQGLGFEIVEGPDVEFDYYNFEALNIPQYHPARDMHDTFYISQKIVLRTHTSPIQVRVMESQPPPVRIIAPGKAYRVDYDVSHTPMFYQVEGLMVQENVSFGDLKGILTTFARQIFDEETSLRFRPSFFPFTEPSAEVDIRCVICRGKGCRVCSHTGWLEVLGAGMVHPAVFEMVGYDTDHCTGFAFGMGVERIAMLKYGIDDIRKFYENDLRFLEQF
ncbi:MAG: phenylalanine--tRNA ligase subunit alpha [Desulfobacterales bacterium C00003060]|nr:MAG: phenylalanine--tRNA ligase subunit alpha [Desulfobacterales bacterium S3730MH5]OEU78751.1 MAG: phenylalanine--tRNA ligase subunit alpha [Desulfobacterales bacterium C00003060]OEU79688.1 MAG: phenylalanine--tRNA ligase subunit alpha [Desulfobacterales bacterium S5133MH4]